ncbi:hypothetical protein TCAP_02701, partial [Tolypocladium capitatum]
MGEARWQGDDEHMTREMGSQFCNVYLGGEAGIRKTRVIRYVRGAASTSIGAVWGGSVCLFAWLPCCMISPILFASLRAGTKQVLIGRWAQSSEEQEPPVNLLGDGEAARQAGALDAQQVDPCLVPVLPPDDEVVEAGAGGHGGAVAQLGPYAGVVGRQAGRVHAGEVLLDLGDGARKPRGADGQVARRVDPFDVRAEAHAAAEVERQ